MKRVIMRIIGMLIAMLICLPCSAAENDKTGVCGQNLFWILDDCGILRISGSGDMWEKYMQDYMQYKDNIKGVVIDEGVTTVSGVAFKQCPNLESVIIPNSVRKIGDFAFSFSERLEKIVLPDTLESIGYAAFYDTAYYNNQDNWNNDVLYICNNLIKSKELTGEYFVREGTICIADGAFEYETYSGSEVIINMPSSVIGISDGAFSGLGKKAINVSDENKRYISIDGVLFDYGKMRLIRYPDCKIGSVYIVPDGVKEISTSAFEGCKSLDSIIISDSVKTIGERAFYNSHDNRYNSDYGVKEIIVSDKNESFLSENGVLFNKAKTELIFYPSRKKEEAYIIPDSVNKICENSFEGNIYLCSINISEGVQLIENHAFWGCINLGNIIVGSNVSRISNQAFGDCKSLKEIKLPSKLQYISSDCFSCCDSLCNIRVEEANTVYTSLDGVLYNKSVNELLIYPTGRKGEYYIPNGVEKIGDAAFWMCDLLDNIYIPKSIRYIGSNNISGYIIKNIYYGGSEENWHNIVISEYNDLENVNVIYNTDYEAPVYTAFPTPSKEPLQDFVWCISEYNNQMIKLNTKNNNYIDEKLYLYIVTYNSEGIMIGCEIKEFKTKKGETEYSFSIDNKLDGNVKIMLWNSNYSPVAQEIEI